MRILPFILSLALSISPASQAAELAFSFDASAAGSQPPGFTNALLGGGSPGRWEVLMDEVTPTMPRLSDKAPVVSRKPVLAQLSGEAIDERFPMLWYGGETFRDFQLTTRFKLAGGRTEQMAGIVFRVTDEKNFYVIRASGLGRNVKFYKVVNGVRGEAIGRDLAVTAGDWHELRIECKGNQIRCAFNGRDVFPPLIDNTFSAGRIGFWTKSDSVSYFSDTRITYKPRIPFAQIMVNDTLAEQKRLKGLRVLTLDASGKPKILASKVAAELGNPGGKTESDVIATGTAFFGKTKESAMVALPLRDRNGDPIAAVWLEMETFRGQTEQNAIQRGSAIVKAMQLRVQSLEELTD
jgi:hypothetical protein